MKKVLMLALLIAIWPFTALQAQSTFQFQVGQGSKRSAKAANLYQQGQSAMRNRRLKIAQSIYEKIISDYPDDVYAVLAQRMLVEIFCDLNEHEKALELLKQIHDDADFPDNKNFARKEMLDILYKLNRFREGIELLEKWRKNDKNNIFLNRQLAKFFLQSGRKDEAWLLLENILQQTASPQVFKDLLDLAIKSGEVEKLISTLERRRTRFKSRDYSDFLSDCYLALDRKDKAIEVLKNTPNLDNQLRLLKKLAELQIDSNQVKEAYNTLLKVENIIKEDWDTLKKLGHCLFLMNRKQEAIQTWQKPFKRRHFRRQEQYIKYTTVLIDHQLYEEALKGYAEGRKALGNRTLFAEEVASVLEALGRKKEALNEYIQVLVNGTFKKEVFEKLYAGKESANLNLEQRLRRQLSSGFNVAIRQALMELYFRRKTSDSADKIVELVKSSGGVLDDFFYERLYQDAGFYAGNFHFALCHRMIGESTDSTLALRIGLLILEMARVEPVYNQAAYNEVAALIKKGTIADADLKAQLLVKLADFSFYQLKKVKEAESHVDQILQTELLKASPTQGLEAAVLKAHILTCQKDFARAESLLKQNHEMVKKAMENIFAANPVGESDYLSHIIYEMAFLEMHRNQPQKALDLLKEIIENYSGSIFTNDALKLALFITRTSVGDFSLARNYLGAKRLAAIGDCKAAVEKFNEIIKENQTASSTPLLKQVEAEKLIAGSFYTAADEILSQLQDFTSQNSDHFMAADLRKLEIDISRRVGKDKETIKNLIQNFADDFPNDLRAGRYRKLLETGQTHIVLPQNWPQEAEEAP
ncbi:MAG: tetratricopeptide repeat protein [Candidatus Rifleibacteriota bacterium]